MSKYLIEGSMLTSDPASWDLIREFDAPSDKEAINLTERWLERPGGSFQRYRLVPDRPIATFDRSGRRNGEHVVLSVPVSILDAGPGC